MEDIALELSNGELPLAKEKHNKPITISWENITVDTPSSKESLMGRIMFFKKEVPSKQIIKNGIYSTLLKNMRNLGHILFYLKILN